VREILTTVVVKPRVIPLRLLASAQVGVKREVIQEAPTATGRSGKAVFSCTGWFAKDVGA